METESNMISFENDYSEGALPAVIDALARTNLEQLPGYGEDPYCARARDKIRDACARPDADVYFISGGTQANKLIISAILRPFESVISASTGHIAAHEGGAIENSGHKVICLPHSCGKLRAQTVRDYLASFYADPASGHMPQPGMVYISFPTEYGTIYSADELNALYAVCRDYSMPFFIDGARLGYGLECPECDLTLPDIASLCDVFYIGGTKVGALCGEAVVFCGIKAPAHFFTSVKQNGALLAKGRLMGVQFDALFSNGLYFSAARHAIESAEKLKEIFREKGYEFLIDSPTNQQFVILDNAQIERLEKQVRFCFWEKIDERRSAVRFATSWATTDEQLEILRSLL